MAWQGSDVESISFGGPGHAERLCLHPEDGFGAFAGRALNTPETAAPKRP
jgi:hypothetical protein